MIMLMFGVGIVNFGLGFFLAVWIDRARRKAVNQVAMEHVAAAILERATAAEPLSAKVPDTKTPAPGPADQSSSPTKAESVPTHDDSSSAAHTWSAPKSWEDFGQQLESMQQRIRFVRSANDKRLAKDLASQLLACAKYWQTPLADQLEQSQQIEDESVREKKQAQLEFCLSQLESSLANLQALNWDESTDAILDHISRETDLLDTNRRSISPQ